MSKFSISESIISLSKVDDKLKKIINFRANQGLQRKDRRASLVGSMTNLIDYEEINI